VKTRSRKTSFASVAVLVIGLVALVFVGLNWARFEPITGSIQAGGNGTYEIKAYSSRVAVTVTSTNGNMNIRIVVDAQTISDQDNLPYVNFDKRMTFGLHTVHVVIENPATLGSRTLVLVTGQLSCSLI
jgi:hypothetical protein